MRLIRFRGKRVDTDQWVYGSFHLHQEVSLCIANEEQRKQNAKALILFDGMSDWNLPIPINTCDVYFESIGQFTGLKDKNGKDIYEGDIVNMVYDEPYNRPHIIVWNINKFIAIHLTQYKRGNDFFDAKLPNAFKAEVIGNIYENPDLLK